MHCPPTGVAIVECTWLQVCACCKLHGGVHSWCLQCPQPAEPTPRLLQPLHASARSLARFRCAGDAIHSLPERPDSRPFGRPPPPPSTALEERALVAGLPCGPSRTLLCRACPLTAPLCGRTRPMCAAQGHSSSAAAGRGHAAGRPAGVREREPRLREGIHGRGERHRAEKAAGAAAAQVQKQGGTAQHSRG